MHPEAEMKQKTWQWKKIMQIQTATLLAFIRSVRSIGKRETCEERHAKEEEENHKR